MAVRRAGARRDGLGAVEKKWMRDAPDMPQLQQHAAARIMYRARDHFPARDLLLRPDSRRVGIADAHRRHRGRFRKNDARRGALDIIFRHHRIRHASRACPAARERRHQNAVGQGQLTHGERIE